MKKINLLHLIFLVFLFSCKKDPVVIIVPPEIEKMQYTIYDSVYLTVQNFNGNRTTSEAHNFANTKIDINKNTTTGELIYNSDTFELYQSSPLYYRNKHGSFPLLGFRNDSLVISRHLFGVGTQLWLYLYCVKNN